MKIRTRRDVVAYIGRYTARRHVRRAIEHGDVELLGGFRPIPPGNDPGWILRVTSANKKRWHVAIVARGSTTDYVLRVLTRVPWENWIGDECGLDLYRGDKPERYKYLRELKRRFHASQT